MSVTTRMIAVYLPALQDKMVRPLKKDELKGISHPRKKEWGESNFFKSSRSDVFVPTRMRVLPATGSDGIVMVVGMPFEGPLEYVSFSHQPFNEGTTPALRIEEVSSRPEMYVLNGSLEARIRRRGHQDSPSSFGDCLATVLLRTARPEVRGLSSLEGMQQTHEINLCPALEEAHRKTMRLQIEKEALKTESETSKSKKIKVRQKEIDKELANLKEKTRELELKWKNEKELLSDIRKLKKELDGLRLEAESAEMRSDLTRAAEIRYGKVPTVEKDLKTRDARLKKLQRSRRILKEEVMEEDIAKVVSEWTHIPVSKMLEEEAEKLGRMEEELKTRVVGQDNAIQTASDAVKRSRAGIADPRRPIASFMFLGPTGVGKTELTKALAEFMFDDDKALIRVDMSEFMERHSVSKMIGSPPGYVGHEEGGALTEKVRHRPYSVVLFDEIEKAHPEVFNILLQVLDDGHLTDAKGRSVNFKNTIIIMTSNVGSEYINKMEKIGFGSSKVEEAFGNLKDKVMESLRDRFRPEFLNRLDDIVVFNILSPEAIKSIVEIQVSDVVKRLEEKEIKLSISRDVFKYLGQKGYNPQFGARPLKRLIQNKILTPVASLMISHGVTGGGEVSVSLKKGEITIEVKKKQTTKRKTKTRAKKTAHTIAS